MVAREAEREAIERLSEIVLDELNVKRLRFVDDADELGVWELKPNYRALGPRFGKHMPQVAAAVGALEAASAATTLRSGGRVGVAIDGHEHTLSADDVQLVLRPREGYQLERAGGHAVALDLELDDALRDEGLAREVVHAVQSARKNAGLAVEDRIELALRGDENLLRAVRFHESYVTAETLSATLSYNGPPDGGEGDSVRIDGRALEIGLARASTPD